MPFAQKTRSRLSYIQEVSYAVTPSGSFTQIPYTGSTLDVTKERLQSESIYSDRMVRTDRHGNESVSGDVTVELAAGNFDDLIAGLMMNDWDTSPAGPDEIKIGTDIKTFTFEDYLADIDQARLFTGCGVSSGSFTFAPNTMVNTTFGLVGSGSSISSSEKSVNPLTVNQPFDAYQGLLEIGNSAATLSGINCITSVELTINNGLEPAFVVGSTASQQLIYDDANVEGSITAYFEDESLYSRFINETETAMRVNVSDPGSLNTYTFFMPRVKFNGGSSAVSSENSRMLTIPFVALRDNIEESPIVIYRPDST